MVAEGLKVLNVAAAHYNIKLNYENYDFGAERYTNRRNASRQRNRGIAQARFHFSWRNRTSGCKAGRSGSGILLKARFALDQYINLRPVKLYPNVETPLKDKGPEDIDFVVIRENTSGIYTGIPDFWKAGKREDNDS